MCELFYFLIPIDNKLKKVNKLAVFVLNDWDDCARVWDHYWERTVTLVLIKSTCQRDVGDGDHLFVVKEQDNFQSFKTVLL